MAVLGGVHASATLESAGFVASTQRLAKSVNDFASQTERANRRAATSFDQTAKASRVLRAQFQQVGFQLQDIVVQWQAGTRGATIFAQQGAQLASLFGGPYGAAIGVAIALTGALATAFLAASRDSEDLQDAIDDLGDTIFGHLGKLDDAIEKYRDLSEAQREFESTSLRIEMDKANKIIEESKTQIEEYIKTFQEASQGFEGLVGDLTSLDPTASFADLQMLVDPSMWAGLDEEIGGSIASIIKAYQDHQIGVAELIQGIRDIRDEFGANAPEAFVKFDEAMTATFGNMDEASRKIEEIGLAAQLTDEQVREGLVEAFQLVDEFEKNQKAADSEARRRQSEAKRLAEQRREGLADLEAEVAGQAKLAEAHSRGADAVRQVEIAIEAFEKIRNLKLSEDSEEAGRILELVARNSDLAASIELVKAAQAQNLEQGILRAEIAAGGRQTEQLRIQVELLKDKAKLGEKNAAALAGETRETQKLVTERNRINAASDLSDTIAQQQLLLNAAGEETEQYRIQLRLLQLKQSGIENITPEMRRQVVELEKQATQLQELQKTENLFGEAVENATQSIQSAFTDAYENILSGGVNTFGELAAEIKRIFIRLAAEIAALMTIRPLLAPLAGAGAAGFGGLFGAGAAATPLVTPSGVPIPFLPSAGFGRTAFGTTALGGGTFMTPSGIPIPSIPAAATPWWMTPNRSFGGLALAGGLGALGGSLIGGAFGGRGNIGGAFGGGAGALAGTALFGPLGGLIGGVGGGLLGGVLGSFFGGGSSGNEASLSGGLGRAGAGGTGAAAKFVQGFDKQMSELLNQRQLKLADEALREANAVTVKYEKELSEGDRARLAEGRIRPVARALGFRARAFEGLGAEEGLAQLGEALELERTIEDLTGAVTPFQRAMGDLKTEFAETEARAKELGISTKGMGRALREAQEELRDQRRFEQQSLRLQLLETIGAGNAAGSLQLAISGIRMHFDQLRESAEELGVSLELVDKAEKAAIEQAREQLIAERENVRARIKGLTAGSDFARRLNEINETFKEASRLAREYGLSEGGLARARLKAIEDLKDQARAEVESLALAIVEPFRRILDELSGFESDLEFSLLNPLQQFEKAQKDFRDIARRAEGGDLQAIEDFEAFGRRFIEEAGEFGASPAQVEAIREVLDANERIADRVRDAQEEASKGLQDTIREASKNEVDTLKEVIEVGREQVEEIRRLQRQITQSSKR